MRAIALLITVVMPGLAATSLSAYYLFAKWAALEASFKYYEKLAKSPGSTIEQLSIVEPGENKHRINCFAEGVGVLLGGVIFAIGIHGICVQSSTKQP